MYLNLFGVLTRISTFNRYPQITGKVLLYDCGRKSPSKCWVRCRNGSPSIIQTVVVYSVCGTAQTELHNGDRVAGRGTPYDRLLELSKLRVSNHLNKKLRLKHRQTSPLNGTSSAYRFINITSSYKSS